MERSKIEVKEYHKKNEEFLIFALLGLITSNLEFGLKNTLFKSIT